MTDVDAARAHDAVVIGGGFYGAAIAAYLAGRRGLGDVVLVERGPALLTRASYANQARVHNGYHYPRSFTTAYRSRVNMPRFVRDWPDAIRRDFAKVYAIARRNSKVTARQFERFCQSIGAPLAPADDALRALFSRPLVEQVYRAEEFGFDTTVLADEVRAELAARGVQLRLDTPATAVAQAPSGRLRVDIETAGGPSALLARHVFNCTYSAINQVAGAAAATRAGLRHEITEMALLELPPALQGLGITMMDGPFFSLMPFPARGLHTLSHVRYTPHASWDDAPGIDPRERLLAYGRPSRADRMLRDVERYLPAIRDARQVDSLFEIKTLLRKNESDDGRPILFEKPAALPHLFTVMGGKIDNIYDMLEKLDEEEFA